METFEAIVTRRSVRKFAPGKIPREDMDKIIEAANSAPSAHNSQPWEFILTEGAEKKVLLSRRRWARFLESASCAVIVCGHFGPKSPERKRSLVIQSCSAAITNMLLAAHALGLGGCWVGDFNEDEVRTLFSIPDGITPVAVVALGHPDGPAPKAGRKRSAAEVTHYESFAGSS